MFGKLGRELAENLDVLVGIDQNESDDDGKPVTVGRIERADGSCYELRLTLLKEGTPSDDSSTATLSRAQKDSVEKARAKRQRKPATGNGRGGK